MWVEQRKKQEIGLKMGGMVGLMPFRATIPYPALRKEFFKLMDEAEVEYYQKIGRRILKGHPSLKRVLVQVPNPETVGEEEYRKFLREYVDHVRKLAGVPPLYSDEEKKLSDQD